MNLLEIRDNLKLGKTIFDLPLKVTYYGRVSTDKYEQLNSLQNQINYYEELIKKNPNWIYIGGYVDEGISGTSTFKREQFLKMLRDANNHKFDLILTKEISRFSRNTLDSIKYTQELLNNDIGVFFECDNINTFMPDSELRLTIMASMAQEEVRKLSERVKFGFQRSIKKGRVLGNNAIWGYYKNDGKLIIDDNEVQIIKNIFEMYVYKHLGMRKIGYELYKLGYKNKNDKPFTQSSIKNILINPKYKGYYCGNKTRIIDYRLKKKMNIDEKDWMYYPDKETVPAIVSENLWNEAQKIIKSKSLSNNKKIYTNRYSLSGKIFCGIDNNSYLRKVNISKGIAKRKKIFWACGNYLKYGLSNCNNSMLYEDILKKILIKLFNSLEINKEQIVNDLLLEYKNNINYYDEKDINNKNKQINNINKKKNILLDLRLNEEIEAIEFKNKNNFYDNQIKKLQEEIENIRSKISIVSKEIYFLDLEKTILNKLVVDYENIDDWIYLTLNKIIVNKKDDRNKAILNIYLNIEKKPYSCINYTYDKSGC